ncbi:hypothetical protein NUU61_009728 [Penicillium alfredii]|uniref:DUF7598 domain-containing protein n=1 Tax=Penicillium alfredii TaxID=1506179 RepID=A0A9W9JTG3_9EURO|nr:uncharacterized protein NUU61_009728 [Penicillium alfredii]KAJ5081464.1 hypothetical protein NUU61_009728 [Penicillium alfredii]
MIAKLRESLAGPGYVILNATRVLNIIVFLDIIAACAVMLVKIDMVNSFFFFQAVSHAIVALISIFLIVSELPIGRDYFDRNWPLFGQDAGFITLAGIMMILGVAVLGHLNTDAMSQKSLGLAFWRIVLSAGILAMVLSVVNIVATFVFSDRKAGVSARHVRVYGAVAPQKVVSRTSSRRSFQLSLKREDSLPTYSASPMKRTAKRLTARFPLKISAPINHHNTNDAASSKYSRDSAGVTMPDLTHHPAMYSGHVIKSVLIFFAPIILPRLIRAYRNFRSSSSSRPPPRYLPDGPARSLNVLFGGIVLFLLLSLPFNPHAPEANVFALTRSRINTPTDVLFHRLARVRPDGELTDADSLLKTKFTSLGARKVYLTFGPDTLTSCQFCSFDNLHTFLLYYLPFHVILPHLVHFLLLGVATSASFGARESARWRTKFTLAGLALFALDVLYNQISLMRPMAFMIVDVFCALILYLSATNRFFVKPPPAGEQVEDALEMALKGMMTTSSKLHAVNVTRNAVVRNKSLKSLDDLYWQTIVAAENPTGDTGNARSMVSNSLWDEEEVAKAISRAMAGQGGVDLAELGVNANDFVRGATQGLEL